MAETPNGMNGISIPLSEENASPALGLVPEKTVEDVSAASTDDNAPEAPKELSAAEKLMQQHELAAQKNETVAEPEVKTEEPELSELASAPVPEKKARKQKESSPVTPAVSRVLDVSSAEAFPSLGGPAKPVAVASWGRKMATPPVNGNNSSSISSSISAKAPSSAVLGSGGQQRVELTPAQKKPLGELRKAPVEIVKDIMKRTGTKIDMAQTMTKTSVFIVTGSEINRQRARMEIFRELSLKVTQTIQIPAIVKPHVIGKGGSKVQELERDTFTKIRVPQQSTSEAPVGDYDDEVMIDVVIEGDEFGVASAVVRIKEIVGERTITTTTRISNVPGEYYPFIQGPNRKNIEEFEKKVDKVSVPDYFYTEKSQPFSPPSGPIVISGEKVAVQEVRAEIEKMVEELKAASFIHIMVPVAASKHKFFTSNGGRLIHEVLEETGCTVILPANGKVDSAIVYGPTAKVGAGFSVTNTKAEAYQSVSIDVCRAHPKAPGGAKLQARDITRYLKQKQEFQNVEGEFDVEVTLPSAEDLYDLNKPCLVTIIGRSSENVGGARAKIQNLYLQYNPDRVVRLDVEPLHHRHIVGRDGRGVQKVIEKRPVELLFPEDPEEFEIVFVYEGESQDQEEVRQVLNEATELVIAFSQNQVAVIQKTIDISKDLHAKIQGERNTTLNALNPSSVLVQFGAPKARPGKLALAGDAGLENKITIRGPQSNVDATIKNINAFLASDKQDETITEPFAYPPQYSGNLIGIKGANINKLRDELGVDINLKDGKGEIKGIRVTVDAAKKKLFAQIKELDDKATVRLIVPQQFHATIIGSGGETVRKLESRYDVRIMFPKSSKSNFDASGEIDTSNNKQGPNEIIIKGGKKGVEEARSEIDALWKYEETKSHSATISVAAKAIEFMFRNAGKEIKQLREDSAVRIDIPQRLDENSEETVVIKIRGTQEEVKHAKTVLSKIAKDAEQMTVRRINVDKKYHRSLIGSGGKTLREIVVGAGGPDDKAALARMVRFPHQDSETEEITVQGNADVVDKIIKTIEKIVSEKENQISITVDVAPEKHRKLIGREGSIRKEMEATFNVTIDIPRHYPGQASSPGIKITGAEENVEKAKNDILERVKDEEGETIMVPRHLYHTITDGGDFVRQLYKQYKVKVNHNNEPRPPKPEDQKRTANGNLPLITDEEETSQNYTWEIEEASQGEDGDYPWVLVGAPEDVAQAKADIEAAVEAAEAAGGQFYIGYLTLPDPSKYRYVVGHGGSQVNKIRRDTGCRITIPRNQSNGEAITIYGSKEGLEEAKSIILGLVHQDGDNQDVSNQDSNQDGNDDLEWS